MLLSDNLGVKTAWEQIRNVLFHPETRMIYDYITSRDPEERFRLLPLPVEMRHGFPNPCGWSTGLEDCALNGGIILDLLAQHKTLAPEFACAVAEGVIQCGTVHGRSGFIARGITPVDGRSCYSNSSRDQFTLALYGLWRFVKAGIAPEDLRRRGEKLLIAAAEYCRQTVTPENAYSLMRLDGGPAVVSGMWECQAHESLRLPMIYGIAWDISREPRYYEWLKEYFAPALQHTLSLTEEDPSWWDMPLLQMQVSLNFFRESGIFPEDAPEINKAMEIAGKTAEIRLPGEIEKLENYSGPWDVLYDNWRLLPMRIREETVTENGRCAVFGGQSYMNPSFRSEYAAPNALLRSIGNYLAVMAHCRSTPAASSLTALCLKNIAALDLSRFSGNGTAALVYGCILSHGNLK